MNEQGGATELAPFAHRLDRACNRFEESWRAGTPPDIDEAAAGWEGGERQELLRELVCLDVYYRRKAGLACDARAYAERFPGLDTASLNDALASPGSAEDTGGPPAFVAGYEVLGEIARGGMGVVYRARQPGLGRLVALKMALGGHQPDAEALRRFRTEAENVACLEHENIVPIHEVGEYQGRPFFSMKLIEGGGLDRHAGRFKGDHAAAASLVAVVARAVHHAHQRGVIHRDLKPSNILLDAEGQPHVADFGLAKRLEGGAALTRTDAVVGTPSYMAPEQAQGRQATVATDVHGLGAVLYELLAGRPPFRADQPLETLRQVLHDDPEPPSRLRPGVPRDLEVICLKCLAKEPPRRYASALELAEDLERYLQGAPITARPASSAERVWLWARRNPALAALSAALVLVGLLGFLGVVWQWRVALANEALADRKRLEAEGAREELRRALYIAKMNLIPAAWEADNVPRVLELLDEARPEPGMEDLRGFEWHYWHRLCHSDLRTVKLTPLALARFGPKASLLAAAVGGGTRGPGVSIVDVASGKERRWLPCALPNASTFEALVWDERGRRVAACASNINRVGVGAPGWARGRGVASALTVWDVDTGRTLLARQSHTRFMRPTEFSRDGRFLALTELRAPPNGEWAPSVVVLALGTGKQAACVPGSLLPMPPTGGFTFSPGGDRLLVCPGPLLGPGQIAIHDASGGKRVGLEGRQWTAAVAGLTPDGKRALGVEGPDSFAVWDAATGKLRRSFRGEGAPLWAAFTDNGKSMVGAWAKPGGVAQVAVWDIEPGKQVRSFEARGAGAWALSPTGATLASFAGPAGAGQPTHGQALPVRLWDVNRGSPLPPLMGHVAPPLDAAFSPDGRTVFTVSRDGELKSWALPTPPVPHRVFPAPGNELEASYQDGVMVATSGGPGNQPFQGEKLGYKIGSSNRIGQRVKETRPCCWSRSSSVS